MASTLGHGTVRRAFIYLGFQSDTGDRDSANTSIRLSEVRNGQFRSVSDLNIAAVADIGKIRFGIATARDCVPMLAILEATG